MKTRLTLLIIPALILSACSTTYYSSVPYDDVYYQGQTTARNHQATDPEYSEVEVYEGQYDQQYPEEEYQEEQEYVENPDYYNDFDFYYNYLFSSRLRRFHRPYYSFGYYNNYYTNMYWYEMNPYMWGSSIYLNTNWMMPYEYAGWSGNFFGSLAWGFGGFNMGWPYYGSGWPYYGGYGGWPHYGYGFYGYNYYSPFYNYHGYYYNSRDSYSHYYQHRPNRGRNYNRPNRASNTFGDMYESRVYASRKDRTNQGDNRPNTRDTKSFTNKSSLSVGTPNTGRNRSNMELTNGSSGGTFSRPYSRLNNANGSTNVQEKVVNSSKTYTKPQSTRNSTTIRTNSRNNPNNKTVRSYNNATLKYSKPNTYKSPNSRSSSSSRQYGTPQKYTNPGTRSSTPSSSRSSNNVIKSLKRVITSPSRSSKSYSSPSRSSGNPISISRSSSGDRSISTPSRSSSKSYSSPSRSSSRSYSSPSRSSSSVSRSSGTTRSSSSSSSSRGKRK